MEVFIGVDIGGSHIGVGVVSATGELLDSRDSKINNVELTPENAVDMIARHAKDMVSILNASTPCYIGSIGIGCPGQAFGGVLVAASNLPKFKRTPLAAMLSKALNGVPVILLNDADAAISAEVWGTGGAYDKYQNIAMFTLGTGIGCGLILDGQLYQGSHGLIEGGHMIVNSSSQAKQCGCGQKGCIEVYSSAANAVKLLTELDAKDGNASSHSDGKDLFARYALNDYNAVKVVEEVAENLATLCVNVCRVLDPQIIVFGGGLAKAGDVLLNLINKYIKQKTWTVLPTDVILVQAKSENGGVVGAALAAQNKFSSKKSNQLAPSPMTNAEVVIESSGTQELSAWFGPLIGVTSLAVLGLSWKIDQTRSSSTSTLHYIRTGLLVSQIGLGIAMLLSKK